MYVSGKSWRVEVMRLKPVLFHPLSIMAYSVRRTFSTIIMFSLTPAVKPNCGVTFGRWILWALSS